MTTEQTGRQDIDSTDSQARIEPTTLVASPPGGDPTPLPRRRAAHGTRTGMRAAPPPIPDGTRPKLAAAPARASSKVMPPPIPSKPAIEIAAHADGMMAAASKPASPLPDPDGWSLPATIEPSGPSYPSVYHPEPAAPDVTVPTGFVEAAPIAPLDAAPSAEWLAKINSVLADEAPPATEDGERIAAAHAHAVAAVAAREKAEAEALARAEAEIAVRAAERAARKTGELAAARKTDDDDDDADTDRSADAEADAVALAKANAAANAALPKLPSARPSNVKLPPPTRSASGTRPPIPAVAAAAAAMFSTKAEAPSLTSPLELVDLEPVETPAKAVPVVPQGLPVVTPAVEAKPVNPLVAAAQASMDLDIEWDMREPQDMTNAHTTDFEMPTRSKLPQRAALGLFVAATFATVGYLATRSTKAPKHAAAAPAAETVAAQPAAPTPAAPAEAPAPAVQAVAAPAAPAAETPRAGDQPQLVQLPVSSSPPGALVTFVDGEKAEIVGRTPTTITIDASKPHDIALTLVGHETQLEHVPVGGMTALAVTLPAKAGAQTPAETAHAEAPARREHVAAMIPAHTETAPAHHAKSHPVEHFAAAAPKAAPSGAGILMISSKPPCEIVVDGKSTHLQTPQRSIPLSPGTHTIMLVNAQQRIHKTVAVDIVAKKPTKVIQDFTKH